MVWKDDAHGLRRVGMAIKEIKLFGPSHTWAMKLGQLHRQRGVVRIITYSLPDVDYVGEQFNRRPRSIYIICNSKFLAEAKSIKKSYPDICIAVHDKAHAKALLIDPETIYVGSANFGRSGWTETNVGIRSKEFHDWYIETVFNPLWNSSREVLIDGSTVAARVSTIQSSTENTIDENDADILGDLDIIQLSDDQQRAIIQRLMEVGGDRFWELVDELKPDFLESVMIAREHRARVLVVEQFDQELKKQEWSEREWENFFRANTWIFGYGLAYRFLSEIQAQPYLGGKNLSGRGGQRGDYLMATQARAKFTVLVEIKTPSSLLVTENKYRQRVHELGEDLIGGVTQLQSNCRRWILSSQHEENVEAMLREGIYTYEPKGILIIGNTFQLSDMDKKATFEMFRRNLHNPEILTYDELLERARFLVSTSTGTAS